MIDRKKIESLFYSLSDTLQHHLGDFDRFRADILRFLESQG